MSNMNGSPGMHLTSALLGILLLSCGGSAGSDPDPEVLPVAQRFPIDGVVDFTGLSTQQAVLTFQPSGVTTTLTWAFANDDRHLYVALAWSDDTFNGEWSQGGPTDVDAVWIHIDDDGDGIHEAGEDKRPLIAGPVGSFFADQHVGTGNADDLVGDGLARLEYDATARGYRAEFLLPMTEDSRGEDAEITASSRYNIVLWDHVQFAQNSLNEATLFAPGAWDPVPLSSGGPWTHPAIPAGLTGLIVFVSTHEDTNGEIYTFDPANGTVFRVTNNSLPENNVSLSHDRTRIAFHAQSDPADMGTMEIYTIHVDGTGLVQLTNDSFINAHPAWSPDDSMICWSPLSLGTNETISIMPSTGGPGTNITPPGVRDSDAEYLPDGRIVFKTDRWNAWPQLQTAVMNGDGSGVEQLTFVTGVSEHDQVGDATSVLFTRFMKGTDFSSDPEAVFTPWNLVEASLNGTGETTILADDWINGIPVYDPTGQYVLYIRMTSFSETVLLTRTGEPLGRLIPGITRIQYIDWK